MNVYTRYEYIETFSVITLVNHGLSDEITFKEIALRQTKEVNIQTAALEQCKAKLRNEMI